MMIIIHNLMNKAKSHQYHNCTNVKLDGEWLEFYTTDTADGEPKYIRAMLDNWRGEFVDDAQVDDWNAERLRAKQQGKGVI